MTDHLTSQDLHNAALGNVSGGASRHLAICARCQLMLSRLRESAFDLNDPTPALVDSLVTASPTIEGLAFAQPTDEPDTHVHPIPGEVWRTHAPASLLLWIRKVVDRDTVDAVPITLDPTMADAASLIIDADHTPWHCGTSLMLDYRSHVHVGALAASLGSLDVAEVVQAFVEGGVVPVSHRVGTPVLAAVDQRLEYRDNLRLELSDLSPSIWADTHPTNPEFWDVPREELTNRLPGISITDWNGFARVLAPGVELIPTVRCTYLGAVTLVVRLSDPDLLTATPQLMAACLSFVREEVDADAIAVFAAHPDQEAIVARRADLRQAIGLPSGRLADPAPYLTDLPLIDILFKHFDRYSFALSLAEHSVMPAVRPRDLSALAADHTRRQADRIAGKGRAAHQQTKKDGYSHATSDPGTISAIERFIDLASRGEVETAIENLIGGDQ